MGFQFLDTARLKKVTAITTSATTMERIRIIDDSKTVFVQEDGRIAATEAVDVQYVCNSDVTICVENLHLSVLSSV
jgi:hypothetical protein